MLIRNFLLITLEFALKLSVDFGRPFASLFFICLLRPLQPYLTIISIGMHA